MNIFSHDVVFVQPHGYLPTIALFVKDEQAGRIWRSNDKNDEVHNTARFSP